MEVLTELDEGRIAVDRERGHFFWLDLHAPSPAEFDRVGHFLRLHPMAMEDSREFGQRPKFDVYEDHVLVVFYTARLTHSGDRIVAPIEVHVYVSGDFILTVRHEPCELLDRLHEALVPEGTEAEDYLVYRIFDSLTDAFYPVITTLENSVDELEAQVLRRARREQLEQIYRLRQEVRELMRLLIEQRDHFPAAADAIRNLAGLSRGTREYLNDVSDHLVQVTGEFQRQNDDLLALAGTYFNANADRLNGVAARLTIIGTLFVLWTLVTGFFGQNFGWLVDNINSRHDFLVFGIGGLLVPTVVLAAVFWVKRRDWF
jgi:magnesium transporter